MNGFDGSLFGSIYHIPQFATEFWNVESESAFMSLLNQLYTLGAIAGAFFAGPASDVRGRRFGMAVGAVVVMVGTVICATISTRELSVGIYVIMSVGVWSTDFEVR